jgi:uncharacterized secreted protein with C-terminal beta-propeller domain
MTLRSSSLLVWLSCLAFGVIACDSNVDSTRAGNGVFESDAPGTSANGSGEKGTTADASSGAGGSYAATPTTNASGTSDGGAARAIEEADIIKIEGTRLYALSQYGGLSVIDIATRDQMRLLGRKKVQAQPFEMYVRDQVVFALYNGYGEYIKGDNEGEWRWVTTSYVMAFDTSNPSQPTTIGRFSIPGTIQDSRIVGNAMYVVGFESNSCWGCAEGQHTTVISLDVSTPGAIRKIDQRSYADDTTTAYSWKRSISVTDQRMYIAGPEYGTNGPEGSVIQVVDISDPTGILVDGVTVTAAGKIDSRWQMDETDGVLRVISQPGDWRPSDPPRIQTFTVASAQSVTKLANVAMVVPANESLRSVRFDGSRGYAITAVQTDPLFTIDLSNPAQPKQVGELVMPGWLYYLEPRGDRVVALGFDQGNSAGALTVSLFDVSNLTAPTMLDRVNFGGDWAWAVEDQDRIHKAFQVLDASNLVLMPFSGYSYNSTNCYSRYQSGVQLIDWVGDTLKLQGVAPAVGQARRGFLHDSRLFTVSDERVETFDISERSKPTITNSLKLTEKVTRTIDAGTAVVKIGEDWYQNTVSVDTTTLAAVESPDSNGHIDVGIGQQNCNSWSNLGQVLANNGKVYLLVDQYDYGDATSKYTTRLVTVDVTNPTLPRVLGEATLDFGQGWQYWYNYALVGAGSSAAMVGDAIAAMGREEIYEPTANGTNNWIGTKSKIYVIDPKNPNKPGVKVVELPVSLGTTGLLPSGTTVGLGHYLQSATNPDRVRFYLDRLDLSDPSNPVLAAGVNVPGSPVAFDAGKSNVVTVDYRTILTDDVTSDWCRTTYKYSGFEYKNNDYSTGALGTCHAIQETIYLVALGASQATVIGSKPLKVGEQISNVAVGDDRVFLTQGAGYGYYGGTTVDCMDCGGYAYYSVEQTELPLVVVSGLSSSEFRIGTITLNGGDYWSYAPMVSSGQRVLLSTGWQGKLAVVDGGNAAKPVLVREAEVLGTTQSLTAINGVGIASLYYDGVQTIRIDD